MRRFAARAYQHGMSIQRVTAGVPTGGQYAAHAHGESDVMLSDDPETSAASEAEPVVVGADPQPMTVAQARRDLPEGQRVQVVYFNGQRPAGTEPDIRTVTKQTSTEMITTGEPGSRTENGSHLGWSKLKAQRDNAGNIVISNADGIPIAAYVPLSEGEHGSATVVQLQATDDVAKAKESVDETELHALAGSNLAAVRERVATNASTSSSTLHRLAADGNVKVQQAVAANPRSSALASLEATTTDNQVRYAIASHANVHPGTLNAMSSDDGSGVRAAVARHPGTPSETLHRMVERERNSDVRTSLSQNPKTPPADLESMSRGSGYTMAGVARNPSTPEATLRRLSTATSTGNHVRAQVAANPAAPVDVIARLAVEPDAWVRKHAASNPSLPSPALRALSSDDDDQVRRAAAGNPNAAPAVLAELSRDDEAGFRAAAAGNGNTEPADLDRLARDESHWVRKNVAANATTRPVVVHLLAQEDGVVGMAASKSVRERGLAS